MPSVKKTIQFSRLVIIFSCLFCNLLNAQWNQIYLSTQADVDEFSITHPSNKIEGSLTIRGESITNLDGLSHIDTIEQLSLIHI